MKYKRIAKELGITPIPLGGQIRAFGKNSVRKIGRRGRGKKQKLNDL